MLFKEAPRLFYGFSNLLWSKHGTVFGQCVWNTGDLKRKMIKDAYPFIRIDENLNVLSESVYSCLD